MKIYIDLDEVVADWSGYVANVIGRPFTLRDRSNPLTDAEYQTIAQYPRMFGELALRKGANELISWVTRYVRNNPNTEVNFLTAIPYNKGMVHAYNDKVLWAHRHFNNIPVLFGPTASEKQHHAKHGDILIDDYDRNISEWISVGGIAHQYTEWENCKIWLEQTLGVNQ